MAEFEDDHRHCKVCGKVIGPESEYCSKTCRRKREEIQANRRNLMYLMYAAIGVLVLLLLLGFLHV